jgi:hypothetical protein
LAAAGGNASIWVGAHLMALNIRDMESKVEYTGAAEITVIAPLP